MHLPPPRRTVQSYVLYRASQKRFRHLEGCRVKSPGRIFKTKMLIYQSKANIKVKTLFREITYLMDPANRKVLVRGVYENENFTFHSGP